MARRSRLTRGLHRGLLRSNWGNRYCLLQHCRRPGQRGDRPQRAHNTRSALFKAAARETLIAVLSEQPVSMVKRTDEISDNEWSVSDAAVPRLPNLADSNQS